jgi:site-specific DNA-cytosine methylase
VTAFNMLQDSVSEENSTPAWGKGNKTDTASIGVSTGSAVRRLTPTECCRLQGLPDDWLGAPNEKPDSPRYAALGDAVTVNVAEWIGRRIMEAEAVA